MLGPQLPYLVASHAEAGGGVGLGDDEEQLANAYPWVHFREFETRDVMQALVSAIDRHTSSATARMAARDADSVTARRCYDPAPIAFWAANAGSRVVSFQASFSSAAYHVWLSCSRAIVVFLPIFSYNTGFA